MDMAKMRNIAFLFLLISGLLVLSSCEKESIYDNEQTTETDITVEDWKVVDTEVSFD